jgi:hypothetical protein
MVSAMSDAATLAALRGKALAALLWGHGVVVIDVPRGHPGLFVPTPNGHNHRILLRTGRSPNDTLHTLCHELGHFWAYSTGRRAQSYTKALQTFEVWEAALRTVADKNPSVRQYPRGKAPIAAWDQAIRDATLQRPNPLTAAERQDIVDEETRAWCLGWEIGKAHRLDPATYSVQANAALTPYFDRVGLAPVQWSTVDCTLSLSRTDRYFVVDLCP